MNHGALPPQSTWLTFMLAYSCSLLSHGCLSLHPRHSAARGRGVTRGTSIPGHRDRPGVVPRSRGLADVIRYRASVSHGDRIWPSLSTTVTSRLFVFFLRCAPTSGMLWRHVTSFHRSQPLNPTSRRPAYPISAIADQLMSTAHCDCVGDELW